MLPIATGIEPHGVTRIFVDRRLVDLDPRDEVRIMHAIEEAAVAASAELNKLPRSA
jgi:hypothetical protein